MNLVPVRSVLTDDAFSLTPTLSRWERAITLRRAERLATSRFKGSMREIWVGRISPRPSPIGWEEGESQTVVDKVEAH